jgi:hypothetical protein
MENTNGQMVSYEYRSVENTMNAAFVTIANVTITSNTDNHGPMVSALSGMGRRYEVHNLEMSTCHSYRILNHAMYGVPGNAAMNMDT